VGIAHSLGKICISSTQNQLLGRLGVDQAAMLLSAQFYNMQKHINSVTR